VPWFKWLQNLLKRWLLLLVSAFVWQGTDAMYLLTSTACYDYDILLNGCADCLSCFHYDRNYKDKIIKNKVSHYAIRIFNQHLLILWVDIYYSPKPNYCFRSFLSIRLFESYSHIDNYLYHIL
jgi:hypothetical protein